MKETKFKNKKPVPDLRERIENFMYSDSVPATATKYLLMLLALGALPLGGAIVPGIIRAIRDLGFSQKEDIFSEKQIKNAFNHLKQKKLIEIKAYKNEEVIVKLTNRGMERVRTFSVDTLFIPKPKAWDGKWRILIFDIPTRPKLYNLAREALRKKVKELGFQQIQKSVWAYPYECEDELLFVAEIFEVQKYIEILTVEKMLYMDDLKRKFQL
jgi:DNA-binding transcriptional regulator PaaX